MSKPTPTAAPTFDDIIGPERIRRTLAAADALDELRLVPLSTIAGQMRHGARLGQTPARHLAPSRKTVQRRLMDLGDDPERGTLVLKALDALGALWALS